MYLILGGPHNLIISNRVRQIIVTFDNLNTYPKPVDIVRALYDNELTPVSFSSLLAKPSENGALLLWKHLPHSVDLNISVDLVVATYRPGMRCVPSVVAAHGVAFPSCDPKLPG
jgi:hypothetical protein